MAGTGVGAGSDIWVNAEASYLGRGGFEGLYDLKLCALGESGMDMWCGSEDRGLGARGFTFKHEEIALHGNLIIALIFFAICTKRSIVRARMGEGGGSV